MSLFWSIFLAGIALYYLLIVMELFSSAWALENSHCSFEEEQGTSKFSPILFYSILFRSVPFHSQPSPPYPTVSFPFWIQSLIRHRVITQYWKPSALRKLQKEVRSVGSHHRGELWHGTTAPGCISVHPHPREPLMLKYLLKFYVPLLHPFPLKLLIANPTESKAKHTWGFQCGMTLICAAESPGHGFIYPPRSHACPLIRASCRRLDDFLMFPMQQEHKVSFLLFFPL